MYEDRARGIPNRILLLKRPEQPRDENGYPGLLLEYQILCLLAWDLCP